jgi:hypothetical protein
MTDQNVSIPQGFVIPTDDEGNIVWPDDFAEEKAKLAEADAETRAFAEKEIEEWRAKTHIIQNDHANLGGCYQYALQENEPLMGEDAKFLWLFCIEHGLQAPINETNPIMEEMIVNTAIELGIIPHGFVARWLFEEYILKQFAIQQANSAVPVEIKINENVAD